ncbi:MAG: hypothetical protein JWN23_1551 [Rhodocyclales bacterium]|nr:hypothetical protein [Rhodocyclales bacterium]
MTITKTGVSLAAAATTVAAATAVNATEWDLSAVDKGAMLGKITNGSSAPTTAPVIVFYAGEATGVKREIYRMSGDTVANSVTPIACTFKAEYKFGNATITGGATNGSTYELEGLSYTKS